MIKHSHKVESVSTDSKYLSAQHTSISVLDTTRVSISLILTYAGRVICERNSDVTVIQQLCHNSITVMSL